MKQLLIPLICCAFGHLNVHAEVKPWRAERLIPTPKIIGAYPEAHQDQPARIRQLLIDFTKYWQARGINRPAPLNAIFLLGDVSRVGARDLLEQMNPGRPTIATDLDQSFLELTLKYARQPLPLTRLTLPVDHATAAARTNARFNALARALHLALPNARESLRHNTPVGDAPKWWSSNNYFSPAVSYRRVPLSDQTYQAWHMILPMVPTQGEGPDDFTTMSFANHESVLTHEMTHQILFGMGLQDMVLHEVFADLFAAIHTGTFDLGVRHRDLIERVRSRLADREYFTPDEAHYWLQNEPAFNADVRNLEHPHRIDPSARYAGSEGRYAAGAPLGHLIWTTRAAIDPALHERFDEATVDVIRHFAAWPTFAELASTQHAWAVTFIDGAWSAIESAVDFGQRVVNWRERRDLNARADQIHDEWLAANPFTSPPWTKDLLRRQMRMKSGDTFEIHSLRKVRALHDAVNRVINRSPTVLRQILAAGAETPTTAEYALPELTRAYHRALLDKAPEAIPQLLARAAEISGRRVVTLKLDEGATTILLLPKRFAAVTDLGLGLAARGWSKLRAGRAGVDHAESPDAVTNKTRDRLDRLFYRLQEFERTGNPIYLMVARPQRTARLTAVAVGSAVLCARILGGL